VGSADFVDQRLPPFLDDFGDTVPEQALGLFQIARWR